MTVLNSTFSKINYATTNYPKNDDYNNQYKHIINLNSNTVILYGDVVKLYSSIIVLIHM